MIENEILKILFPPDGAIPLAQIDSLPLIRKHIAAILQLSGNQKVRDVSENRLITQKIIELHDKGRGWSQMASEIGISANACRKRYSKMRAKQAFTEPELPVAPSSKVTEKPKNPRYPKIPHSEDELIMKLRDEGKLFKEIRDTLQAKGIVCEIDDVCARHAILRKARERAALGKLPHNAPTSKEAGQANRISADDQQINSPDQQNYVSVAAAEPSSLSRAELDHRIWEEWKDGLTPKEISDRLCAEGFYYSPGTIRSRLIAQGASL